MGQVGEGGVPVQGNTLRRALLATGAERICRTFSCGAESSGEGQYFAVPSAYGHSSRAARAMSRQIGWASTLLPSRGSIIRQQSFAMKWDLPIRPIQSGPLTDREIEELNAFLLAGEGLEHPMDFYTFDGFICAVLSGPNTIMPSEWLRWVWDQEQGEQPPEFTGEKQAKRILCGY